MKNKTHIVILASLLPMLFFGAAGSYAQNNVRLKVISFNVRSFEPNFDITPYAELLQSLNPDIIGLNEVENRSSRQQVNGKYRDVVQDLANKLSMFGIFGYSYNLSNKEGKYPESNYTYSENELYGNAILCKYPIMNSTAQQLPRPASSSDQRGVLSVDVLLPSMKMLKIVVTHLDHVGGQLEQAKAVISDKVLDGKTPTILVGDLNVGALSFPVREILTKFDRMDNDTGTYGGSKIDYIFGSKDQWKLIETRVISSYYKGQELSDHSVVYSEIELIH